MSESQNVGIVKFWCYSNPLNNDCKTSSEAYRFLKDAIVNAVEVYLRDTQEQSLNVQFSYDCQQDCLRPTDSGQQEFVPNNPDLPFMGEWLTKVADWFSRMFKDESTFMFSSWALCVISRKVWKFLDKNNFAVAVLIRDSGLINEIIDACSKKDAQMGQMLRNLFGYRNDVGMLVCQGENGNIVEVHAITAEDTTIDDTVGKLIRFERETRKIRVVG